MTIDGYVQIILYMVLLIALVKPLGWYMARVYSGKPSGLDRVLGPLERLIYRLCGVRDGDEMGWKTYALAMLLFNLFGIVLVYLLQRAQALLPLNPQGLVAASPDLSFNTAVSFGTNTNWQSYGGEVTLSYLTQMLGLTVQNFVSAASGMATLVALILGIARRSAQTIGNFWIDLTRSILYILLPLALVFALILVAQGVPQTFNAAVTVPLLQATSYQKPQLDAQGSPVKDASGNPVMATVPVTTQTLPLGPAASQIAIKQLGTNGGGFYNVNSAHPFENPNPLSNFLQLLSILLIAAALCYTFGVMVNDVRQGWAVLAAMTLIFIPLLAVAVAAESNAPPLYASLGVDTVASDLQPGGNMEGKELRFGIGSSALWASATTAASNGSVNSMHDSFTPLGGLVPLFFMHLSEVIYGGVGSGLYGMLVYAIIAVFVAGLMVGRTPEYLGKKIEAYEMKMASIVILIPPVAVLIFTALATVMDAGRGALFNPSFPFTTVYNIGPHGFSEILYAFSSMGNNNGSAFAGLGANNPFYNALGGILMWIARYWLAIPTLAIAGSLAAKKLVPAGPGTLPTHTPLFITMLIGVVIIVGALSFLPVLALGPIVEHLLMVR
jgi:K+-transporting ATPase ATPase A chain